VPSGGEGVFGDDGAAPSDLGERLRLEDSVPLRHFGWVPLDQDRAVRVRSECIKSTPSILAWTDRTAHRFHVILI
jgi:hypothetical protein